MAGEEAPAYQRQRAEAGTREPASETLKQMDARDASERPVAVSWSDADRDGIPDVAELGSFNDRENFRRWFTAIAEMQFYSLSDEWSAEQRDCAGLARFSWREALRRHDRQWFQRMGSEYEAFAPDVAAYTLESNPLGEKLFRARAGAFKEGDLERGTFSEFADARSLKEFNCRFISRDRRLAEPGDLIFFFQPWTQKQPFHAMIFLGAARTQGEGARDWVVYHTGASRADAGVVKKVRLAVLDHHPDKRWRPIKSNPNFLGFYRLNILD
ncbi:MAG: uncharacterized protein QOF02_379 [Blastocatellia bacterium]|jgi:uncharacterized protein YfaT (DUF1175 family)|nr:uncharacterized protein [Blastocatellia bacterium]